MKTRFLPIILLIVCALHLSTFLQAQNAFAGIIEFDKTVHDFGDLMISDGKQHCSFSFKNISNEPIVVHDVITSCGCTDPQWTRQPILPGKQGKIDVTFNNDLGPYPFDKSLTVYVSNVNKPLILRIRGNVHEKPRSLEELFPVRIGHLGLREMPLNLGQIEQGLSRTETVEIANLSHKALRIEFLEITPGLILRLADNPIPARGKTSLTYSIDTKKSKEEVWGKNTFSASVSTNGTRQKQTLNVEALIKENFSTYNEQQRRNGALPQFKTSTAAFERTKAGKDITVTYTCKNGGKDKLILYKIDGSIPGIRFEYPKEIAPGESATIRATFRAEIQNDVPAGEEALIILTVITNSPVRPILSLFITGIIE